jgi:hypothetical protein
MSSIEKEDQLPVKRVMSEKQLENLRIGRERGVEKKRMAKLEREGIPPEEVPPPPPEIPAVVQPKRVRASRAKPKEVPKEVLPPPVVPEVVPEVVVKPKRVRAKPQPAIQYEQQRMEANEQQYYYQQPPPQYNPYYFQPQYQPQQQPIPQPRRRGFRRI